jgi:hypothetical protein
LGILKVKLPPEIALQDSSLDEFSPQGSPSPVPSAPRHTFQRTQSLPPQIKLSQQRNNDPLDLSTLGITEKPLPLFKDDSSKMDWIPSSQQTTFSRKYSHNLFSSQKGTLPPSPGTLFPIIPSTTKSEQNWFKSPPSVTENFNQQPQNKVSVEFREQRYFPQQALYSFDFY